MPDAKLPCWKKEHSAESFVTLFCIALLRTLRLGKLLGGGNKKRGLQAVREAAIADAATFVRAEAGFSLWDMQVRERDIAGARATALILASDFPGNPDLRKFLDAHADDVSGLAGR